MTDINQEQIVKQLREDLEKERKTQRKMVFIAATLSFIAISSFIFDAILLGLLFTLPAGVIWYLIYLCRGSVGRFEKELHVAETDMEQYQRILKNRTIDANAQLRQAQAINEAIHPTCPKCGSHSTKKITTLDRSVSVAAAGLASSKIGKQFECKDCKYKW
nr:hypothetical protein [uncultured Oscillibacter sp.]